MAGCYGSCGSCDTLELSISNPPVANTCLCCWRRATGIQFDTKPFRLQESSNVWSSWTPKRLRKMFVNCPPWILKIARMIQLKFAKILWNCNQYRQCLPTIRSDACPQAQVSHQVPRSLVHCASLCPMMIQWWPSMAEAVTRRGAVSCMSRKYKDKSLLKHVHYIYTHINIYIYA